MVDVKTRPELIKALMQKAPEIHIADQNFTLQLLKRLRKDRCILFATCVQGYKMRMVKCLGLFDISFIRTVQI